MAITSLSKTNTFTADTSAEAAKVNTNFDEIVSKINEFVTPFGAITASAVELNYAVGVTSAIQDQLNAKAPSTASPVGKHTIWVPAKQLVPRTTAGAAATSLQLANNAMIYSLDYDTTTQEYAQFFVSFPKSWNEGTVTFKVYWAHPATTVDFGVTWNIKAAAFADAEDYNVAFAGAGVSVTDTGGTTSNLYISDETAALTVELTPTAYDFCRFEITRVVGDAGDTMAVDAKLIGVALFYTTDAATDA